MKLSVLALVALHALVFRGPVYKSLSEMDKFGKATSTAKLAAVIFTVSLGHAGGRRTLDRLPGTSGDCSQAGFCVQLFGGNVPAQLRSQHYAHCEQ